MTQSERYKVSLKDAQSVTHQLSKQLQHTHSITATPQSLVTHTGGTVRIDMQNK